MTDKYVYHEKCEECGRKMISQRTWAMYDKTQRAAKAQDGFARKGVRGLCSTHYTRVLEARAKASH